MARGDRKKPELISGKIGDRIGIVIGGKQYYKSLYSPTNPRTPEQQKHRAKLAFVNRLSAQLAEAVNRGFAMVPKPNSGVSPRNAFVKTNWNNGSLVWDEEEGAWHLCPKKLVVANGPLFIDRNMSAMVENGVLYITCPNSGMGESYASEDDRMTIAIFGQTATTPGIYIGPLRREIDGRIVCLPPDGCQFGSDDPLHVYVWFKATLYQRAEGGHWTVTTGQSSPSLYLGAF